MSLRALLEEVNKQRKEYDAGLYNEDVRTIPRSQAQKLVPSRKLRPGSYKQMLRAEEQDALELVSLKLSPLRCFWIRFK